MNAGPAPPSDELCRLIVLNTASIQLIPGECGGCPQRLGMR